MWSDQYALGAVTKCFAQTSVDWTLKVQPVTHYSLMLWRSSQQTWASCQSGKRLKANWFFIWTLNGLRCVQSPHASRSATAREPETALQRGTGCFCQDRKGGRCTGAVQRGGADSLQGHGSEHGHACLQWWSEHCFCDLCVGPEIALCEIHAG